MALLLDNCESILLSLDSHKSVPAPFLTKTYQLVDDPTTDHIVSWGEDDTTFVVWRPPEFARDLLPNYFKHNNFSSFVRQLNTYGFRKIVPDRWEFANEFFKKGEKHLLCEIHRRKTSQPQQVGMPHHHHHSSLGVNVPAFFPFSNRPSISPPNDSEDQPNWCDSPPLASPIINAGGGYCNSVTALSEDNERLRRSNTMLMSELAHMKKLYNDIIYFVQNHVKPVPPSNTTTYSSSPSSLLLCSGNNNNNNNTHHSLTAANVSMLPRAPINQLLGYNHSHHHHHHNNYSSSPKQVPQPQPHALVMMNNNSNNSNNSPTNTSSRSSITVVEGTSSYNNNNNNNSNNGGCKTKLFGVSLQSKKRVHPEYPPAAASETNKARLVIEKDDLGLNLMPPSTC